MLHVTVCDDEEVIKEQVVSFVKKWSEENHEEVKIYSYSSPEIMLADYRDETDIVLLDIKMERLNGVETAKELRKRGKEVCIIFITSMTQYAIECYKVRAFGFLTKPVCYEEFKMEFSDAAKLVLDGRQEFVIVRSGNEKYKIAMKKICYLEVDNHVVSIHEENGDVIECYETIKNLETQLKNRGFFRCHAGFLVNQRYIVKIGTSDLELAGGTKIPISKHRRAEFMMELAEYVGGRM